MSTIAAIALNVELNLYKPVDQARAKTLCNSYLQTAITRIVKHSDFKRLKLLQSRYDFYEILSAAQKAGTLKVTCNFLPSPKKETT